MADRLSLPTPAELGTRAEATPPPLAAPPDVSQALRSLGSVFRDAVVSELRRQAQQARFRAEEAAWRARVLRPLTDAESRTAERIAAAQSER